MIYRICKNLYAPLPKLKKTSKQKNVKKFDLF